MLRIFVKETQKFAIDQLCECGHLHSEHHDRMQNYCKLDDSEVVYKNSGGCKGCNCQRFRWAEWHYENS